MGSLLQLLTYTRWEVFCTKIKMQFLVLLLSATLATVAYGAANPGGHHFGHAHHVSYAGDYHKRSANPGDHGHSSGPYCEDKKEKQCHKHPKENSRKLPKQTCKKIVDTIYIEECEERIYTHCEESHERGHHSTRVVDHHSKVIAAS